MALELGTKLSRMFGVASLRKEAKVHFTPEKLYSELDDEGKTLVDSLDKYRSDLGGTYADIHDMVGISRLLTLACCGGGEGYFTREERSALFRKISSSAGTLLAALSSDKSGDAYGDAIQFLANANSMCQPTNTPELRELRKTEVAVVHGIYYICRQSIADYLGNASFNHSSDRNMSRLVDGLEDLVIEGKTTEHVNLGVNLLSQIVLNTVRNDRFDNNMEMKLRFALDLVAGYSTDETRLREISSWIQKRLGERDMEQKGIRRGMLNWIVVTAKDKDNYDKVTNFKDSILNNLFEQMGICRGDFFDLWDKPKKLHGKSRRLRDLSGDTLSIDWAMNLGIMLSLEERMPGSVKYLHEQCGIVFFARYGLGILLDQYRERNNTTTRYGIVINPHSDYNDTFYGQRHLYDSLNKQGGSRLKLRIYETDNKNNLMNIINECKKKYGKIAYAVIGGHGSGLSVLFGDGKDGELYVWDLTGKTGSVVGDAFEDEATIILNSCNSGMWFGIAMRAARVTNRRFVGPMVPARIKSVELRGKKKIRLKPEYYDTKLVGRY